ncbi:MAG TPA: hypothetical protein VLF90_03690 [Patescibacteria group bacterium]|nr:hypothetical protein [Patescibacteria group bacterium]
MAQHVDTIFPITSDAAGGEFQATLHLVQPGIIGKIEPGKEKEHAVPELYDDTMRSFFAMVEMLYAPVMDGDNGNTLIAETVGRVEVYTDEGEKFLITHGNDDQGNSIAAVLTHDGRHEHDHALSIIDAGDRGIYTEQHRFRYSNSKLIESFSEPIKERDYVQVFDRMIDLVMTGNATIVANP